MMHDDLRGVKTLRYITKQQVAHLGLLGVVQSAGPVYGDVRGTMVQPRGAVHRAARAAAESNRARLALEVWILLALPR